MNADQEDITADNTVDNVHSEDVLPNDKPSVEIEEIETNEDVIMKESIVTNVSEGKPSDIRFELREYMEHETRPESQENIL